MDGPRFDSVLRALSQSQPRRGALVGVLGGIFAATLGREVEADEPRKRRRKQTRDRQGESRGTVQASDTKTTQKRGTVRASDTETTQKRDTSQAQGNGNSKRCIKEGRSITPCCPGLVARSDGVCATSVCFTGVNPCQAYQQCPNSSTACGCMTTSEGDPFCAVNVCGVSSCRSSEDCGPNEKCVPITDCCAPEWDGMCMAACPTGQ